MINQLYKSIMSSVQPEEIYFKADCPYCGETVRFQYKEWGRPELVTSCQHLDGIYQEGFLQGKPKEVMITFSINVDEKK